MSLVREVVIPRVAGYSPPPFPCTHQPNLSLLEITCKCCKDGVLQPIKWEIFSVLPIAFPLLMWRFQLTWRSMSYILPWVTELSQEAGAALHMLGRNNAQKLFYRYILPRKFGVQFFDKIYHLGAWRFEMVKTGSCFARKWRKRVGIEPNATIGQMV